jgi:hypothetical protein
VPDNIARWAAFEVSGMPRAERRRAARLLTRDADGVPHPPHDVRCENARAIKARGLPLPDIEGSALFKSFDAYATRATRDLLVDLLRRGARLVPLRDLIAPPSTSTSTSTSSSRAIDL